MEQSAQRNNRRRKVLVRVLLWLFSFSFLLNLAACGKTQPTDVTEAPTVLEDASESIEETTTAAPTPPTTTEKRDELDYDLPELEEDSLYQLPVDHKPNAVPFYRTHSEDTTFHALTGRNLFRLVNLNKAATYIPDLLAQEPEISEDGLNITLTFRNDSITAHDFYAYMKEFLNPLNPKPAVEDFLAQIPITGALAYFVGDQSLYADANELYDLRLELETAEDTLEELLTARGEEIRLEEEDEDAEDEEDEETSETTTTEAEATTTEETTEETSDETIELEEDAIAEQESLIEELSEQIAAIDALGYRKTDRETYDNLPQTPVGFDTVGIHEDAENDAVLTLQLDRPITELKLRVWFSNYSPTAITLLDPFDILRVEETEDETAAEQEPLPEEDPEDVKTLAERNNEPFAAYFQDLKEGTSLADFTYAGPYAIATETANSLLLDKQDAEAGRYYATEQVLLRILTNFKQEGEAFVAGKLDEFRLRGDYTVDLNHEGLRAVPGPTWALVFQCERNIQSRAYIDEWNFRTAVGAILDRYFLIKSIAPQNEITTTVIPESARNPFDINQRYREHEIAQSVVQEDNGINPVRAEAALAEINYRFADLRPYKLRISIPEDNDVYRLIAEELKMQWEMYHGERMTIEIKPYSLGKYFERNFIGKFDVILMPLPQDPMDPLATLAMFRTDHPLNVGNFSDALFDAGFDELVELETTLTEEEWFDRVAELENILLESYAVIPLFQQVDLVVYQNDFNPTAEELPGLGFGTLVHSVEP